MRHDAIDDNFQKLIFEFFFCFSRFEFALKEASFLKTHKIGAPAEPSWEAFEERHRADYVPSEAARALIDARPKRQIVAQGGLAFADLDFRDGASDLERVVRLAKTVRNNLFHGGKHGVANWDDPARTRLLLSYTLEVLRELAKLGDLEPDFTGLY